MIRNQPVEFKLKKSRNSKKTSTDIKSYFEKSLDYSKIESSLYDKYGVKRGLRNANGTGVLVLLTKISDVYGYKMIDGNKVDDEGHLYYRGYDIYDLLKYSSMHYGFERVCFLILFSHLPTDKELEEFHTFLADNYELSNEFVNDHILNHPSNSVMNQIQRTMLSLYSYDNDPDNVTPYETLVKGINIIAMMPSIISYCYRSKRHYVDGLSLHIRQPKKELSIAENLLHMSRTHGNFTRLEAETLDLALILHADHGGANNSTFANIVISSSATDIYSAMTASLGSLKGPRHGGANIAVKKMMDAVIKEIGLTKDEEVIRKIINDILDKKFYNESGLIYGIGHPVYTLSDPRAILLKNKCHELAIEQGYEDKFNFYATFEKIAIEELKKRKKINVCFNIDFYSGLTYEILQINEDLFTPIFACGRMVGWLAHNIENKLYCDKIIRPAGKYVGEVIK